MAPQTDHTSSTADRRLDPTYAAARSRFLDAARRRGAEVTSFPHSMTGREGEELAIDVAVVGPDAADSVVLIVSGTHGVEGYAGSALQSWWLDERAGDVPDTVRVVVLHGFNPYGFSWVRRVNEDNVDLNRNFVDWSDPPANEAYGQIAEHLVPEAWTEASQSSSLEALLEVAGAVGMERFQEIVSSGQYSHPTGIFHGGTGPVWSHRWLEQHIGELVGTAARLAIVDLHTGLGPWGHGELISHESADTPGYQRGTKWWGDVRSMRDGESVSASLSGDWLAGVDAIIAAGSPSGSGSAQPVEVTAAALEYGTVDVISVLQSLRADAWLHAHGDPTGDDAGVIRNQVRQAFADDDPAWLTKLIGRFDDVASAAIRHLA